MAKGKKKAKKADDAPVADGQRHVNFKAEAPHDKVANGRLEPSGRGLRPSPSTNTLNRLDRETYVIWRRPLWTLVYAVGEIGYLLSDFVKSLWRAKLWLLLIAAVTSAAVFVYKTPGEHQPWIAVVEKHLIWSLYWVFLGVLSSIGFGSGLHTFLIYLGPWIASVTLAAYECNSIDFPEPPYPDSIVCPTNVSPSAQGVLVSLWSIVSKVRVESLMWGAGTALGELPPYFMARAARLSGEQPDDEEYREFLELTRKDEHSLTLMDRCKQWVEKTVANVGFPGILLFASVPNPFFDLAGITCGHFLVPFWTFFGATLIGKAIVKMHVQMLFVVVAFSEHHVERVVSLLSAVPLVGDFIRGPLLETLAAQKKQLHRAPGSHVVQKTTWLQSAMGAFVTLMIFGFLLSIINSLAQRYHRRRCEEAKKKSG